MALVTAGQVPPDQEHISYSVTNRNVEFVVAGRVGHTIGRLSRQPLNRGLPGCGYKGRCFLTAWDLVSGASLQSIITTSLGLDRARRMAQPLLSLMTW